MFYSSTHSNDVGTLGFPSSSPAAREKQTEKSGPQFLTEW